MEELGNFVQPGPYSLAVVAIAGLLAGLLSPLVVWNRAGLLSDTVSHASLVVVALAAVFNFDPQLVLIPFAMIIGLWLARLSEKKRTDTSSHLALIFSGSLGVGTLLFLKGRASPHALLHALFGEVENVNYRDLIFLTILFLISLFVLVWKRKEIQLTLLNADIAFVEGVSVRRLGQIVFVVLAVAIAATLKVMGVVLVTSLFVAPALIASSFAKSAVNYVLISLCIGFLLPVVGFFIALKLAIPAAACIAVLGLFSFGVSSLKS